jgi:hypothetical protein
MTGRGWGILVLLYLLLVSAVPAASQSTPQPDTPQVWFDDINQPLSATPQDEASLLRYIVAALTQSPGEPATFPATLSSDTLPRILFLSVSDGQTPAHVFYGTGFGLFSATDQVLARATAALPASYQPAWFKLDIVQTAVAQHNAAIAQPLAHERSLYGLAFDRASGLALLPEELVTATLVDSDQMLRPVNIAAYLSRRPAQASAYERLKYAEQLDLYRFTSRSLFWDGGEVLPLYRGHRMFDQISSAELLAAAQQGGSYLARSVKPDGSFIYSYLPKTSMIEDDYNILRHSGTIYAMLELYEITGDQTLLEAAHRAISYLTQAIRSCPTPAGRLPCVVEDGYTKLGGNALAVVALAKYTRVTGDRSYLPLIRHLGRWIRSVQAENGQFIIHKQSYPQGENTDFVSGYYPGEALLALNRIYALDPDPAWLDSAEASAQYLITVRDASLSDAELPHDHWLLYALNELYRQRANPLYREHARRIAGAIVASQNRHPAYPDWRGSFYQPPRSTPTATRMEGLCAAHILMRDTGYLQEAAAMFQALQGGIAFQLQTQFRPEKAMYLTYPQLSSGGIKTKNDQF